MTNDTRKLLDGVKYIGPRVVQLDAELKAKVHAEIDRALDEIEQELNKRKVIHGQHVPAPTRVELGVELFLGPEDGQRTLLRVSSHPFFEI